MQLTTTIQPTDAFGNQYGQAQNCGSGIGQSCIIPYTFPYQPYVAPRYEYHYSTITVAASAEIEIRSVANGFVVKHLFQEYVFGTAKEMAQWLEKHYKEKK